MSNAFQKITSGIPKMDEALHSIRMGDNVVWQVDSLEVFRLFVTPFVSQAIKDKRNLIYIRFSNHEPLVDVTKGVKLYQVDLSHRFETFTLEIHDIIEQEGKDAFYVFDCLSELQVAWSTDLMMGNFFRVTCPYLFELDTVAWFPILRGRHSFSTIAKIQETTQLLMDAFYYEDHIFVQPLKVWNRYSPTMFMPHEFDSKSGAFTPLTDGIRASKFYTAIQKLQEHTEETQLDSWDRFFTLAHQKLQTGTLGKRDLTFMRDVIMTRDERLREMIDTYFQAEDYFMVRNHMVGTGMIGGKACGMLLARKIIDAELPQYREHIEPHDSFFIGSDVYYTYLVENNCWKARVRQRTKDGYFSAAKELKTSIENGNFSENIREQFRRLLTYFGQSPIIVRSSSILEDGFGNAFAGKYESVFCPNMGDLSTRLSAFERAVKIVYASTMDPAALEYRLQRGMEKRDEQMALLVQRVSGSYYPPYFMPHAAGVGFSYSTYKFMEEMDSSKGMLRLVMGLGTKAVDRTDGDYPRLVSLDMPTALLKSDSSYRHKFSQHKLDVLDLEVCMEKEIAFEDMIPLLPDYVCQNLLNHDYDTERIFRDRGIHRSIFYVGCDGLTGNETFTTMMRDVLATLQKIYAHPVDIEYTINLGESGNFMINFLQCRPLQTCQGDKKVELPTIEEDTPVLFHCKGSSMGASRCEPVDVIVNIDPLAYYSYPYATKPQVAKIVGQINEHYKHSGKRLLLLTPGRIGTSSPELGVPVTFGEISNFHTICEVAYSKAGYMPELSYGSHMFQDLVEADILYVALFENKHRVQFTPDYLKKHFENQLSALFPQDASLSQMIQIYEVDHMMLYHDFEKEETFCISHFQSIP